jgi:charged multivesicular body protein 2A
MGNMFGKEKPLKEVLRENKRMITRAIRELDREKVGLEKEEKRLTMEIKKAAKEGQMSAVKIMAKVGPYNALLYCVVIVWWFVPNS